MKTLVAGAIALFVCAVVASPAPGQQPAPLLTEPAGPLAGVEAAPLLPPQFAAPPSPLWSVDLVFGLPTAVRAQRALSEHLVVEGLAGLELIFPFVGVGLRGCFTPLDGERDALCVNPGMDVSLVLGWWLGGAAFMGAVSADVDVLWRHTYASGLQGEFGVKLGAASVVGWRRGLAVPVVGLVGGWRF